MAGWWGLVSMQGALVDENQISRAAENFVRASFFVRDTTVERITAPSAEIPYWITHLKPAGFVVFNCDSQQLPIAGFGTSGSCDLHNASENVLRLLLTRQGHADGAGCGPNANPNPNLGLNPDRNPHHSGGSTLVGSDPRGPALWEHLLAAHALVQTSAPARWEDENGGSAAAQTLIQTSAPAVTVTAAVTQAVSVAVAQGVSGAVTQAASVVVAQAVSVAQSSSARSPELPVPASGVKRQTVPSPSQILVPPLLATHWSQWAPYNSLCPSVANALEGYGGQVPTGCVPVAMGQVLRYYSWPQSGIGADTYTDSSGVCTGKYTATWSGPILWENLQDNYGFACAESPEMITPIASFLSNLGISAAMDYEAAGSASDVMTLGRAMVAHLGYSLGGLTHAGTPAFGKILEQEIGARRPAIINIPLITGHTAVGDGLAIDSGIHYVHLNFGYGGQSDAWFPYGTSDETNNFDAVVDTFHPGTSSALVSCGPNFIEQVAANNAVGDQTLSVLSCANAAVNYSVTCAAPWIKIVPGSGVTGSSPSLQSVQIDASSLPSGINDASLIIKGNAANLPRTVRVRIYKPDPPQIVNQPADAATLHPTNQWLNIVAAAGDTHTPCSVDNPLHYQWFYNSQPLSGATNTWCQSVGYGTYQCAVTSLGGTTMSRAATVAAPAKGSQLSVAQFSNGKITLQVANVQSGKATLQTSTNAKDWQDWQAFNVASGTVVRLQITISGTEKDRFYRIRE